MTPIMGIRYVVCFNSRSLGGWLVTSSFQRKLIVGIRYVVYFNSCWLGGWLVTSIIGIRSIVINLPMGWGQKVFFTFLKVVMLHIKLKWKNVDLHAR